MKTDRVKLQQFAVMTGIALSGIGGSGAVTPATALTFNFTPTAGTSQLAIDGFRSAGALWSSVLNDNVNVNININFTALSPGLLGESGVTDRAFSYGQVYNALKADRSSADDNTAVSSLANNSTFNLLLNRTSNSPFGAGSATPYLDNNGNANNNTIRMTSANAKALGLVANGSEIDANISFSNLFTWDFDRSNGIGAGAFDFVGIAAHEIGHTLGFDSGVDILDAHSSGTYYADDMFDYVTPLDLFRYSDQSKALGVIDGTADNRDKYFSLDGGVTKIAAFSTGQINGDGRQASHWKDDLGLGILDPTARPGELLAFTDNDKRALDAIGWNLTGNNPLASVAAIDGFTSSHRAAATAVDVPEPANFVGTFIFSIVGAKLLIKRRRDLLKSTVKSIE